MSEKSIIDKFLEERQKGIGGSDSPVILGVSPFKTLTDLWFEKKNLSMEPETPAMKRGKVMEPIIADMYEAETGRKLIIPNEPRVHPDLPHIRGNPDRDVIFDDSVPGPLEIKCPGIRVFGKIKREGVPNYYQVQLQHYMGLTDAEKGSLAVFNAENWQLLWFDVPRDDELIEMIYEKDTDFWKVIIESDLPPDVDIRPTDMPAYDGAVLKLENVSWKKAVENLRQAKAFKAEAEEIEKLAKERLQTIMEANNAEVVEGGGARIYWRHQSGNLLFDVKALKRDHPKIHEKYVKVGKASRPFRPFFFTEDE